MTIIKIAFRATALSLSIATLLSILSISNVAYAAADESAPAIQAKPAEPASTEIENWAVHGQLTNITQGHSTFMSPYSGTNSLLSDGRTEETTDVTLMLGRRLWAGAELWIDTELDQGFGFSNTLGVAGFPNGGAYKVGANTPYLRVPKAFIRQVISFGGEPQAIESGANQFSGTQTTDNVTITVGKFAVPDVFDTNSYAHDPRADFLNWTVIDAGAFDYAADSWGYTYGAAAEWTQDWWTLRAGVFQLSTIPNGKVTGVDFGENSVLVESEQRHTWMGHPGKIKLLAWINHGRMGSYQEALKLAQQTGSVPSAESVRRVSSRPGIVFNAEQELTSDLGGFFRLSANRGDKEAYEFTDVNQSLSTGVALKGDRWSRHDDVIGLAAVVNRLSGDAQAYFGAGGLGVLVGDGRLNYAPEKIIETYYAMNFTPYATLSLDYQHISNPAYNQDRGPVAVYGVRLHGNF